MKVFLKILRNAAFPILIVIFILFALQEPEPKKQVNVVDTMFNAVEGGRFEKSRYVNEQLGISVSVPEISDKEWSMTSFDKDIYYEHHLQYIQVIEHEIFKLKNADNIIIADMRIEYIGDDETKNNEEAGRLYSAIKLGRIKRNMDSRYLRYTETTDFIPVTVNDNTFYTFTLTDYFWGDKVTPYCIRHGSFGVSITFYNRKLLQDPEYDESLIMEILGSLELTKPEFELVYFIIADDGYSQ